MDEGTLLVIVFIGCGVLSFFGGKERAKSLGVSSNIWSIWGAVLGFFFFSPSLLIC